MDCLPPEILSNIVAILEGNGSEQLGSYASISIAWQAAIEKRTFRQLPVKVDPNSLEKLREILVADARRAHIVRTLKVDLGKSPLDKESRPEGPSKIDTSWWCEAIARLFATIPEAMVHVQDPPDLCLSFCSYTRTSTVADWEAIRRDAPSPIPQLNCVTKLEWQHPIPHVSEADLFAVTNKLPRLKECSMYYWDDFSSGRRQRMKHREGLVDAIVATSFHNLTTLALRAVHDECQDEAREPTNLTSNAPGDNESSIRMTRHLATLPQLTILHLTGSHVISTHFFRDFPAFPALVDFQLDFASSTSDAEWFFLPDEDLLTRIRDLDEEGSVHYYYSDDDENVELYDSDDEDGPLIETAGGCNKFRTMPNPDNMPNLLIDAAHMAQSSTQLRKFILRHRSSSRQIPITWTPSELMPYGRHMELWYLRAGARCNHDNNEVPGDEPFVNEDRIYWRVGERWRPDARVVEAWRSAVGPEVRYCFLKDLYDYSGESLSWDYTEDLKGKQYVGDLEWEAPGRDVNLELNELKQPFERSIIVSGPWSEK